MGYAKDYPKVMRCAEKGCEVTHDASFAYAVISAHSEGWFQQKDGQDWCPAHNPPWVAEWRKRRAEARQRSYNS